MQEIICHIGFPKTGTTFLQQNVFSIVEPINYIDSEEIKKLLYDVVEKDDSYFIEEKINEELMKLHHSNLNMLFSYEPLTGHHLKTEFPNRSQIARRLKAVGVTKIIITIRNQLDVLESTYKQYIKSGGILKISKFFDLNNNLLPHFYINYFDYAKIIELYSKIFGIENVLILQFEKIFTNDLSFTNRLASFLNARNINFYYSDELKVNKSLSNFSIKLLRIINHFTYNSFRPSNLISKRLSTNLFFRILRFIDIPNSMKENKLIEKYKNEINDHFFDSNSSLIEKYNINLDKKYLIK